MALGRTVNSATTLFSIKTLSIMTFSLTIRQTYQKKRVLSKITDTVINYNVVTIEF